MKKDALVLLGAVVAMASSAAYGEDTVRKTVDTGSHTCTSIGQEKKVYDTAEAGSDRFFIEEQVSFTEVSKFLAGNCTIEGVEKRAILVTLPDGTKAPIRMPVKYTLRAFADCTNDPGNLNRRMSTECAFVGPTVRYK